MKEPVQPPRGLPPAARQKLPSGKLELSESVEWLAALTNSGHDVVLEVDGDGSIVFVSASSYVVLGYEPQQMIGRPLLDFVYPDDHPALLAESKRAFDELGPMRIQSRFKHENGEWRWFDSAGAWPDSGTTVTAWMLLHAPDKTKG